MKKNRNAAALVLALVLAFSMSVSAFAAGNGTATLDVYVDGEIYMSLPVDVTDGVTTVKDGIDQNMETLEPDWISVPEVDADGNPTGVICQALNSLMEMEPIPVGAESGIEVEYWSSSMPGYGMVNWSTDAEGKIVYHYVYVGYAWTYSVGDETPDVYMDQYALSDGDVVTLDYGMQTAYWDSYDYIFAGES